MAGLWTLAALSLPSCLAATDDFAVPEVVWTTPSLDSSGSMPLGNGDVGVNLWVEADGDLLFYLSKTDAWSDHGRLLKLGRVRVAIDPNPFAAGRPFAQTLALQDGEIRIDAAPVAIRAWVDAHRPVVWIEVEAAEPVSVRALLERWRVAERRIEGRELFSAYGLAGSPEPVIERPDVLLPAAGDRVIWYHRNEHSTYPATLRIQGLEPLLERYPDPLQGRTFGAVLAGDGLRSAGDDALVTASPWTRTLLRVVALTAQTATAAAWVEQAQALADEAAAVDLETARTAHRAWWRQFWERSHVVVEDPAPVAAGEGIVPTHRPLRIGACSDAANRFHGLLKRARVFARALSPEEIAALASDWGAAPVDSAGLLGDWTFAQPVDGAYPNAVRPELPARIVGQVTTVDSELGPAAGLTGEGYLEAPFDPAFDLTDAVTLEAWIAPDELGPGGGRLLDTTTAGTSDGYLLDTYPGNSLRLIVKAGTLSYPARLTAGRWAHVAGTFDRRAGTARLYLNGREVARADTGPDLGENTGRSVGEVITRGYALQRFVSACGGRGAYPIKFNGSIFTVDPREPDEPFDPDYRRWGGPYWFQNTRLAYWPMLAAGDLDLMEPFFGMYRAALPFCRDRTRLYFGHDGAFYPETMTFWGAYATDNYGWDRTGKPISQVDNPYIRWYYDGALELLTLMLERYDYRPDEAFRRQVLLPTARAVIAFYDQHYPRDEQGRIRLYPAQALETWQDAVNPLPPIAGLRHVLDRLLALPADEITGDISDWRRLAGELPPLPTSAGDDAALLPAEQILGPMSNSENPELYAIFPYRLCAVGQPGVDLGRRTFAARRVKRTGGWTQDAIQAAWLGLAEEAARDVTANFATHHRGSRFPAFWGPNFDWVPDQDHGSVAMMALQSMLLQADGRRLLVLPAWPARWNVRFKLHAPWQTVVSGEVREGRLVHLEVTPPERRADVEVLGPATE